MENIGLHIYASPGTGRELQSAGVTVEILPKIDSGQRPNILDKIKNEKVHLILNTATHIGGETDEAKLRRAAVQHGVPIITTITGCRAAAQGIYAQLKQGLTVRALQDYF